MSIENARETLESAREDLVDGRQYAQRGQQSANETFSRYAEAEGHRNRIVKAGEEIAALLDQAGGQLDVVARATGRSAERHDNVSKMATATEHEFAMARVSGDVARSKLANVLDQDAATICGPYMTHVKQAATYATITGSRAHNANLRLQACAERMGQLRERLGEIATSLDVILAVIPYVDYPQHDVIDAIIAGEVAPTEEFRAAAAENPAASLENSFAATEAFDGAIRSVDERLGHL